MASLRKKMMDSIDNILDQYVSERYLRKLIVEWERNGDINILKHIPEFVPKSAFTPAQLLFMQNDPAWRVVFPERQENLKQDPYKNAEKCEKKQVKKRNEYLDDFEICDSFAILTRQGVVLLADDALVTPEEDRYLNELCRHMQERKDEKCSE